MGNDRGALKEAALNGHHSWSGRDTANGSNVSSRSAQRPTSATPQIRHLAAQGSHHTGTMTTQDWTLLDGQNALPDTDEEAQEDSRTLKSKANTLQSSGLCLAGAERGDAALLRETFTPSFRLARL